MLKKIESIIVNSPFYNIVRYNFISDAIIEILHHKTKKNLDYYNSFLDRESNNKLIFDVGANKGNKIKAFLQMGFDVVAFEPEHKAIETIEWRFKKNPKVIIEKTGVSDAPGELTLHITDSRSGYNTLSNEWVESLEDKQQNRWEKTHKYKSSYTVPVTTLDAAIKKFGMPYFIKIDVEGFELNVIKGLSKLPGFLSFETNLPEFRNQTIEIIERLHHLNNDVTFCYSANDNLNNKAWISASEMKNIIHNTTDRYYEIICKSTV